MCFYTQKNPLSILLFPGFSRTVSMYRGPVLWWCNSLSGISPAKDSIMNRRMRPIVLNRKTVFLTYMIRITE